MRTSGGGELNVNPTSLNRSTKMGAVDGPPSLPLSPAGPPTRSSLNCLDLPIGHIQLLPTLPQGLLQISGAGTGLSSVLIYHGECTSQHRS